jgi:hypothetical protein
MTTKGEANVKDEILIKVQGDQSKVLRLGLVLVHRKIVGLDHPI